MTPEQVGGAYGALGWFIGAVILVAIQLWRERRGR